MMIILYMEQMDGDADMAKMADPKTLWVVDELRFHQPAVGEARKEGEWWADMEEVYHLD